MNTCLRTARALWISSGYWMWMILGFVYLDIIDKWKKIRLIFQVRFYPLFYIDFFDLRLRYAWIVAWYYFRETGICWDTSSTYHSLMRIAAGCIFCLHADGSTPFIIDCILPYFRLMAIECANCIERIAVIIWDRKL